MSERQKPAKNIAKVIRKGLAATALTGLAAVSPGIAPAKAEQGAIEKLHSYTPTKVLEKRANEAMNQQRDLGAFNGVLLINSSRNNGGTEAEPAPGGAVYPRTGQTTEGEVIEHPVVVFRGNPKDEFGHDDLTNGDYAFGKITRSRHPKIELLRFNPQTMELVPWSMENGPLVESFIFQSDKLGNLNLGDPLTSSDGHSRLHGGPLEDASGQPWQIGLDIKHPKG